MCVHAGISWYLKQESRRGNTAKAGQGRLGRVAFTFVLSSAHTHNTYYKYTDKSILMH